APPSRSGPAVETATPVGTATPPGITLPLPTPSPPATADLEASCSYRPVKAVLPVWARAGFRPPYNGWPFVTSQRGDTLGVLFGYPMEAPRPARDGNNKILWVSKAGQAMTVDAQLVGTPQVVHLGAVPVGPSFVDVPTAGCWHLTLHLSGNGQQWTDTVDIGYVKG